MAPKSQPAPPKIPQPPALPDTIDAVETAMAVGFDRLGQLFGTPCYPLMTEDQITYWTVNSVYDDLRARYGEGGTALTVVLHNAGGDINSAFNLGWLFRRYGTEQLNFVIPRWAKSAATLLAVSGDRIYMAPPAELGPLDPQIHAVVDQEHHEQFSPLHINAALALIRDEYANGHAAFAAALMAKLQFPLTLGSYTESLKIGEVYLERLLGSRMLKGMPEEKLKDISRKFSRGFADHAYSILCDECGDIGLAVEELSGDRLDATWDLLRLFHQRERLEAEERRKEMAEKLRTMAPEELAQILEGFDLAREPTEPAATNGARI